ncbi:MAG: hypothetical protein H6581_07695 [Bacteroidia bacterium]|nr:hypothetical protein [Bacteroidia bacterium]
MSNIYQDPEFLQVLTTVLQQSGFATLPSEEPGMVQLQKGFSLTPLLREEQESGNGIYSMHLGLQISHPFLPDEGVIDTLVSFGHSRTDALWQASMIFKEGLIEALDHGLQGYYFPELDFKSFDLLTPGHWHVLPGPLQGNMQPEDWGQDLIEENDFFLLLKDIFQERFQEGDFHWAKIYLARNDKGQVMPEVRIDNEVDSEATEIVASLALRWKPDGRYRMIKQFIFFRRCEAEHD